MGDLTYLIIFLVVMSLVGRIFRALQKSARQQTPGTKPKAKSKDPFTVLAERLEKLGEAAKQIDQKEKPLPRPYVETEELEPEISAAETPQDFAQERAATAEAEFEQKPRTELHEESFPWQDTQYGYRAPVQPVTRAPGPEEYTTRSYRNDVIGMLGDRESVRNAVLLANILGPCRARKGRYRFLGPR